MWLISNRSVSLTVLESEESEIKAPAASVSDEGLLPLSFHCVLTW